MGPKQSLLDPASRILVISHMLAGVTHILRIAGQLQNRTNFRLRLLLVILTIDSAQIVRTLVGYRLGGLETFIDIRLLLIEIAAVCRIGVEFVPWRVIDGGELRFFVRIGLFPIEEGAITRCSIEGLPIGVELHVLNKRSLPSRLLGSKRFGILGSSIKWNILILVLHPRDDLLPHLHLLSRVMFAVCRVDVIIGLVLKWVCMRVLLLSGGGFFQVLMGCLMYYDW